MNLALYEMLNRVQHDVNYFPALIAACAAVKGGCFSVSYESS